MILHIITAEEEQRTKHYLFIYLLDLINAWKMEHVKILKQSREV